MYCPDCGKEVKARKVKGKDLQMYFCRGCKKLYYPRECDPISKNGWLAKCGILKLTEKKRT